MCDLCMVFAKKIDGFQIRILQHNIHICIQKLNLIKAKSNIHLTEPIIELLFQALKAIF